VDPDGDHEDGAEAEEEEGVDEDGDAAGAHAVELRHASAAAGDLAEQPRREEHEEEHRDQHGAPVSHLRYISGSPSLLSAATAFNGPRDHQWRIYIVHRTVLIRRIHIFYISASSPAGRPSAARLLCQSKSGYMPR